MKKEINKIKYIVVRILEFIGLIYRKRVRYCKPDGYPGLGFSKIERWQRII